MGEVIERCSETVQVRFLAYALTIARGLISEERAPELEAFMTSVGYDPSVFDEGQLEAEQIDWRLILELGPDAELGDVHNAFKKLAIKHHPDFWHDAPPKEKATAEQRMKQITVAYAAAKAELGAAVQPAPVASRDRASREQPSSETSGQDCTPKKQKVPEHAKGEVPDEAANPAPTAVRPAGETPLAPEIPEDPKSKPKSSGGHGIAPPDDSTIPSISPSQRHGSWFTEGFALGVGVAVIAMFAGFVAWNVWLENDSRSRSPADDPLSALATERHAVYEPIAGPSSEREPERSLPPPAEGSSSPASPEASPAGLLGKWMIQDMEYEFLADGRLKWSKLVNGRTDTTWAEWKLVSAQLSASRDGLQLWAHTLKRDAAGKLVLENRSGQSVEMLRLPIP
jgi:hypothetical protein